MTEAVWVGAGLIAVSGLSAETLGLDGEAAGVTILDTEDWTSCVLERRPTHVAVTGGTLLAWGGADFDERGGVGLIGYDLTDGRQWHLFGRQYLGVQVYGPYAYAINSWDGWHVSTVDVSTGHVLAEHEGRPPTGAPERVTCSGLVSTVGAQPTAQVVGVSSATWVLPQRWKATMNRGLNATHSRTP